MLSIYVISCERYETLALCLAGLANNRAGAVHVIDDHSQDPRVVELLSEYHAAGLIASVEVMPQRSGIGVVRRRVIDRFLAGPSQYLVQVEGDMLLPPHAVSGLATAYEALNAPAGEDILPAEGLWPAVDRVRWLCAYRHEWVHATVSRPAPRGIYAYSMARGGSEPFWCTSRDSLEGRLPLIPASRPDLVLFLRQVGGAVLEAPEIQAQHIGCINSFYYPQFKWEIITHWNADGTLRQPYPHLFQLDFTRPAQDYPALYLRYAAQIREEAGL